MTALLLILLVIAALGGLAGALFSWVFGGSGSGANASRSGSGAGSCADRDPGEASTDDELMAALAQQLADEERAEAERAQQQHHPNP